MQVFQTILPIMLVVIFGFIIARQKIINQHDCDTISKFVFDYLIPALLFIGTVKATIPVNMQWEFLISFYLALFCVFVLAVLLGKYIFGYGRAAQSVFSMGASYSNATIIGLPVCIYALGDDSLLPLFMILSIHNLILFCGGIIVAESAHSFSSIFHKLSGIFRQLITSPITASLLLGGMLNVLSVQLYKPLEDGITMLSQAAIPMALFALGASLNKYKVRRHIAPALVIVTLKVILFPLLVWLLAFKIFIISSLWAATALLTSAMPVGVSAYIFSQKYREGEEVIASSIVISTIASIFSLSFLITYTSTLELS